MPRILVVEDETLLALDLRTTFEGVNLEVAVASTVECALQQLLLDDFSGAVLDACLHGTWAAPVAAELERRGVPYIVYSGSNQENIAEWAHPVQFLQKPAPHSALVAAVHNVLAQPRITD